ncbi:MAG TPA: SDR family oxidoreductase [Polyangiaceae bacterium]|nr:SDR family oxidoreductase [Polyangiaceae bacterium]
MPKTKTNLHTWVGAAALYGALHAAARRWRESRYALRGRVVLITGGSRGLGLLVAREYARHGAQLALVARSGPALDRACDELRGRGADAIGVECDVSDPASVSRMIDAVMARFGRIDIVVNDAGQIEVGPLESMTVRDFRDAMDTNFWGAFNVIHAAYRHLTPGEARIVNISSVGGIVSVPHLLPYSASKFALQGFSLGLGVELARRGVRVVTVAPGLMRTGSPTNASFKGDAAAELAWFSVADSLPLLSMSGDRAARAIVSASRRGDPLLVLGLPAKLAALAQALFPNGVARASALVNRLLPDGTSLAKRAGHEITSRPPAWLTALSDRAAARNNELG